MATTAFGTNDPRTIKHWSKKMFKFGIEQTFFYKKKFMGTSPDAIIHIDKTAQEAGVGDAITFELEAPMSGTGIGDHGNMVGNSEALTNQNFKVDLHERGHSAQSAGPLSDLRTTTKFRESAKRRIGQWFGVKIETDVMRSIFGLGNETASGTNPGTIRTVKVAYPGVGSNFQPLRHLIGGQNTAGTTVDINQTAHTGLTAALTSQQLFGSQVILAAEELAERAYDDDGNQIPIIRKINVDGEEVYIMLIHPWQEFQLKRDTYWLEAQKYANVRGSKNPILNGALGRISKTIVHRYGYAPARVGEGGTTASERWIPTDVNSILPNGVMSARAVMLGCQAGVIGWGKQPTWRESPEDAGRKPLIGSDGIYCTAKSIFNVYETSDVDDSAVAGTNTAQLPLACITVDTQIQDPRAAA